jgi:hypothetical protein
MKIIVFAHILLLGIFPMGTSATDPTRTKVGQINQMISKLDDGKNVTYLDIGGKFLQPDGALATDLAPTPDFKILSENGYKAWADAIQPVVDQYRPKSAASPPGPPTPPISSNEPTLSWPLPPPAPGVSYAAYPTPAEVNSILATYDDGNRVTYSYIGDKFLQPDGTLTADIMPDFLHPSAKGYGIGADAIQPFIDKYFPQTTAK